MKIAPEKGVLKVCLNWRCEKCVRVCKSVWECGRVWESVWVCECVWECGRVWESVWECGRMWESVGECGREWEIVWDCVRVCESVWECVRLCETVWDCVRLCETVWDSVRLCECVCECLWERVCVWCYFMQIANVLAHSAWLSIMSWKSFIKFTSGWQLHLCRHCRQGVDVIKLFSVSHK